MIAVLIDSRHTGFSGWTAVRSARRVVVSGMRPEGGDEVVLRGESDFPALGFSKEYSMNIVNDGIYELNGQQKIQVEIVKISEESRISVDLE